MDKSQKKRLKRNKTKFGNRKYALKGIISSILAFVSFCLFWTLVILSYKKSGNAGVYLGTIGITALLMNVLGCVLGIRSFREKERNYFFSRIGLVANAFFIAGWVSIYFLGF